MLRWCATPEFLQKYKIKNNYPPHLLITVNTDNYTFFSRLNILSINHRRPPTQHKRGFN